MGSSPEQPFEPPPRWRRSTGAGACTWGEEKDEGRRRMARGTMPPGRSLSPMVRAPVEDNPELILSEGAFQEQGEPRRKGKDAEVGSAVRELVKQQQGRAVTRLDLRFCKFFASIRMDSFGWLPFVGELGGSTDSGDYAEEECVEK